MKVCRYIEPIEMYKKNTGTQILNLTGRQPFRMLGEISSDFLQLFSICMQCTSTNSSYTVDPIPTKLGEPVLKSSTMKNKQKLLHKLKGMARPAP